MGFMDIVHFALDVAGFLPVVGTAADLANAAIYAAEGDWMSAGISLISATPGVGNAVGFVAKTTKIMVKSLNTSESLVKISSKMTPKLAIKPEPALLRIKELSLFSSADSGKLIDGAKKVSCEIKETLEKNAILNKENNCFTEDTLVCTYYGFSPVKEVQEGDDIYSRNEMTGETGIRKVEEVIRTEAHTIYHIWLDGREEIKATAYHPVYVKERGWVCVINLREGDIVETMDGSAQITKVMKVRHEDPVIVYNFHIKEWETYFVSQKQVYVHNCGRGGTGCNPSGKINGKTPAVRLSYWLSKKKWKKRPNTVAVLQTADGKYYVGVNSGGVYNDYVQKVIDKSAQENSFGRKCAEVNAVSKACNKGANLEGAIISVAYVRNENHPFYVQPRPPCNVCKCMLDDMGIKLVE